MRSWRASLCHDVARSIQSGRGLKRSRPGALTCHCTLDVARSIQSGRGLKLVPPYGAGGCCARRPLNSERARIETASMRRGRCHARDVARSIQSGRGLKRCRRRGATSYGHSRRPLNSERARIETKCPINRHGGLGVARSIQSGRGLKRLIGAISDWSGLGRPLNSERARIETLRSRSGRRGIHTSPAQFRAGAD